MTAKRHNQDEDLRDKLRAYDGKDYTEIIEFPVELVDRDGVVRRYSYEESLAVYHRRIQSAPWRYGDDELIRAEIGHCTRRIDQIKRSYSTRRHTGESGRAPNPRASLGEGYDLLRRYYDQLLGGHGMRLPAEPSLTVTLLQDEPTCRVYHVGFEGTRGGHLLYVYPFDRRGDGDPQQAWSEAQASYRGIAAGTGVERLLFSAAGDGLGVLVTGANELPEGLRVQAVGRDEPEPGVPASSEDESQPHWMTPAREEGEGAAGDAFEDGVTALHEDRTKDAIECFRRVVEQNPYHREGYLALLAVLDGSGRYAEADMYGEMAGRHLPDDGLVRYRQAINMVRQGKLELAIDAFDEASELAPSLFQPSYFAAQVLVARGRDLDGALRRLRTAAAIAEDEAHVHRALRAVERCVALRRSLRIGGVGLAGLAVTLVILGEPLATIALILGGAAALVSGPLSRALSRWLLQREDLAAG
jgi:tetratricopeptide (TPR) repeat protein